jgi:hypothetical protein
MMITTMAIASSSVITTSRMEVRMYSALSWLLT